jgi:hypothetical protein
MKVWPKSKMEILHVRQGVDPVRVHLEKYSRSAVALDLAFPTMTWKSCKASAWPASSKSSGAVLFDETAPRSITRAPADLIEEPDYDEDPEDFQGSAQHGDPFVRQQDSSPSLRSCVSL